MSEMQDLRKTGIAAVILFFLKYNLLNKPLLNVLSNKQTRADLQKIMKQAMDDSGSSLTVIARRRPDSPQDVNWSAWMGEAKQISTRIEKTLYSQVTAFVQREKGSNGKKKRPPKNSVTTIAKCLTSDCLAYIAKVHPRFFFFFVISSTQAYLRTLSLFMSVILCCVCVHVMMFE